MRQRKSVERMASEVVSAREPAALLADLRELILQAREGVARVVNSGLATL